MNQRALFLRVYFIGVSSCRGSVSRLVQSAWYVCLRFLRASSVRVCVNVITGFSNRDVSTTGE